MFLLFLHLYLQHMVQICSPRPIIYRGCSLRDCLRQQICTMCGEEVTEAGKGWKPAKHWKPAKNMQQKTIAEIIRPLWGGCRSSRHLKTAWSAHARGVMEESHSTVGSFSGFGLWLLGTRHFCGRTFAHLTLGSNAQQHQLDWSRRLNKVGVASGQRGFRKV